MLNRKKRILFTTEATFLASGYATYYNELLKRLHKSGKFEVAELACAVSPSDVQGKVPWRIWGNNPINEQESQAFGQNHENAFGAFRFTDVCLEFQPDIVCDIRDCWTISYLFNHPYRKCYKLVMMPAIDALPQQPAWLDMYGQCEKLLSYTDWAIKVLKQYNLEDKAFGEETPAGIDLSVFKPSPDRKQLKAHLGMPVDSFIVGTVNRNQPRKLFPDLLEDFRTFLDKGSAQVTNKTYLYLHTSYPDTWNLPEYIHKYGLSQKVFITYKCNNPQCNFVAPMAFKDVNTFCPKCRERSMAPTSTSRPISREDLSILIQTFDVYVQYATNEAQGIGLVEGPACGAVPFAVDYTGMSDLIRKLEGYPIQVDEYRIEPETGRRMAVPNGNDFVAKLDKYLSLPESLRQKKEKRCVELVHKHYDWDKIAQRWERALDEVDVQENQWRCPADLHQPVQQVPDIRVISDLVNWGIVNVLGKPELVNTFFAAKFIKDLTWGYIFQPNMGGKQFQPNDMLQTFAQMRANINQLEEHRKKVLGL